VHKYLSAIGFKHIESKQQLNKLLEFTETSFQVEKTVKIKDDVEVSERIKHFTKDMGLMVCGTYDQNDKYEREHYIPFFLGKGEKKFDEIAVERHIAKNSYAGACEYPGIGITLIYYLQNAVEYLSELKFHQFNLATVSLTLSGLASEGKILLPVIQEKKSFVEKEESIRRQSKLIKEARSGDESAIESLTMQEMDTYSMISKRIENEDVLSIVSTYFMPCGLECDQYSILGEILKYEKRENSLTKEKVYVMTLDCNGLEFDVCINAEDLMGEPEIGRRLKASIWLQGRMNFEEIESI
jgi:hypothetical protein